MTGPSPLDLIYLAAASIRAGKAGPPRVAWCKAIDEARMGYVIVLENAPGILAQIDAGLERMAAQENGAGVSRETPEIVTESGNLPDKSLTPEPEGAI